ncbi:hypothetical protein KIN20_036417 [Parelaphostrongylus tenuis]|uniref:Uncharacterized protein n=1 Tax=Parelaphostrongylus tenuis TaxID=148309 RepID=A0AAD5RDF9_PARTN|nr:hypothetical protein KIN20_036417 [Parelaphostrongylus tenuis]
MKDLIRHVLPMHVIPPYPYENLRGSTLTSNAEREIGDEIDGSMEDNRFVTDTGSGKALSSEILSFYDDKQVFKAI